MEQLWRAKELVPRDSISCSSGSLLFLSELNSFSSMEQYKVLILLVCSSVPQKPHLWRLGGIDQ